MRALNLGILAVLTLLLTSCSLRIGAKSATMYEIYYANKECTSYNKIRKNIFIDTVGAGDLVDSRRILIVAQNNEIRYLDDAKFVALPSEMIYKALVKGVYSNCGLKPIFSPNEKDLKLKIHLISLQIRGDKAEVMMAYQLFSSEKSIVSGMITKEIFCPNPHSKTIFDTLNKAVNLSIDELLGEVI